MRVLDGSLDFMIKTPTLIYYVAGSMQIRSHIMLMNLTTPSKVSLLPSMDELAFLNGWP
jgi:hypothetical protein